MKAITPLTIFLFTALPTAAADMEWVKVSDDNRGFVLAESGQPFIPWGFNYDHEGDGRLIDDYWDDQWPTVESAFREMKGLGANVVRIHLQCLWVRIDQRWNGSGDVMDSIKEGYRGGIPWFAILDVSGEVLATSDGPGAGVAYRRLCRKATRSRSSSSDSV